MDLYSSVSSVSCASGTNAWTINGTLNIDEVGPGDKVWVGSRTASTPSAPLRMFRIATINKVTRTFTTTDNADQLYSGVPFYIDYAGSGVFYLLGVGQRILNRLDEMFGISSLIFAGGGSRFLLPRQSGSAAIAELMFGLRTGETTTAAFFLRQRQVSGVEVLDFIATTDGTTELVVFRITRAGVVSFPSSLSTAALQAESLNGGPLGGLRNLIDNGGMDIWQRGGSGFTLPGPTADLWRALNVTSAVRSTDVPDSRFTYSLEFGNSSADYPMIQTRLEGFKVRHLFNRRARLSFFHKNVSGASNLFVYATYAGSYENFGSPVAQFYNDGGATPAASWTRMSYDLGTVAANVANGWQLQIFRGNSSPATSRITGVQLEIGDVATAFEHVGDRGGIGAELERCRRQIEVKTVGAQNGSRHVPLVAKRAGPALSVSAGSASNITPDGFELSHSAAADITVIASAEL